MKRPILSIFLATTIATLLPACGPTERSCASNADCLAAETCVLGSEGGHCSARAPAASDIAPPTDLPSNPGDNTPDDAGTPDVPSDPGDDPTDPTDPTDPSNPIDPTDPEPGEPRLLQHGVVSGAGAARSATFRVTQEIGTWPRRVLVGSALEVRN